MIVKAIKREFKNENKINLFNCHRSRHMWVIFFRTSTFFSNFSMSNLTVRWIKGYIY